MSSNGRIRDVPRNEVLVHGLPRAGLGVMNRVASPPLQFEPRRIPGRASLRGLEATKCVSNLMMGSGCVPDGGRYIRYGTRQSGGFDAQ